MSEAADSRAFDLGGYPRRLNLGCGWDKRPDYLNVDFRDFHEPDLVADIRDLSMLPSGHFDEVLAQDVLEHLPRDAARPALAEWARLLAPGGELRLRVPNLLGLLHLFEAPDRQTREEHETLVQCLYGTQAYDGDWHCNGFTERLLREYLVEAGLTWLQFTPRDEWLFDVVATKPAPGEEPEPREVSLTPTWTPNRAASASLSDPGLAAAIATAHVHADLGEPGVPSGRFVFAKRVIAKAARFMTHHQVAFNHAVLEALERLAKQD